MEKNFFPESINIDNTDNIKMVSRDVSTLEGHEISFIEDTKLAFSDTTSTIDVFRSRLIISVIEKS